MSSLRAVLILLGAAVIALCSTTAAADSTPDYSQQDSWQSVCGLAQSPVDILTAQALPGDAHEPQAIRLHATRTPLHVTDNGHAIQVDVEGPDAIIRGRHFTLAQFHFHSASEHTIDGQAYPAEGHFVFKAEDGRLAVVAVMYRPGKTNRVADAVLDGLAHSHAGHPRPVDIADLLPARKEYYRYLGSLTTPPLNENVEWYVLSTPMTFSAEQIERFRNRHDHNNRQPQPLNGRPLIHYAG